MDQCPDVANQRAQDPEYWMLYRGLLSTGLPVQAPAGAAENGDAPEAETPSSGATVVAG